MVETESHIFPTTHRVKHSKDVSYPIGAEILSRSLEGVPQHELITCSFSAGRQHDDGKPQIYVLHVLYQKQARNFHHGKSAEIHGVFEPRWSISIFAVPRQLRGAIKLLLLEQGLPDIVRPWLIEKSHLTGQTGGSALWLEYDRADKVFKYTTPEDIAPERSC